MLKEAVILIPTLISLSKPFLELSSLNTSNQEKSFEDILGWIEDKVEETTASITWDTPQLLNLSFLDSSEETSSSEETDLGEAEWLTTGTPDGHHAGPKLESIISGQDIDIGLIFKQLLVLPELAKL